MSSEATAPAEVVSIVLPVHNQRDHIEAVLSDYFDALDRQPWTVEVVLVTNACTDGSDEVCAEVAARDSRVVHIDTPRAGWGAAVRLGVAGSSGDLVCYTNAARTTGEMLVLMLLYARAYPGVVVKANRRIRDNWRRRLGSVLYNLECRMLFDLPTWDINGTPKIFPRRLEKLLALTRDDDLVDLELLDVCMREGYKIIEVPILATVRHGGRSTTNYRSALRMYVGAYRLSRARRARLR